MAPSLTFVYSEVKELSKNNELLVITNERLNAEQFPYKNVIVLPFKQNKVIKKIHWLLEIKNILLIRKNVSFKKKLNKIIDDFNPNIIHAHFGYEALIFTENYIDRNIPLFITFHGYDASQMLRNKVYVNKLNATLKNKNIVAVCVSGFIKNNLISHGIKLNNFEILYCGIDSDMFIPQLVRNTSDKFIFLQISVFNEKKGHKYTIDAFKLFLDKVEDKSKYKLILAGGLNLFESIKKYTEDIGLKEYVEFPGSVNHSQAKELYNKANVFLHHSIVASNGDTEGLPNAIMEAMAMELPIVSTYHAGIPELVEHSVNGYLVNEKDVANYSECLLNIIQWGYKKQNREKILSHFTNQVHLTNLLTIYNKKLNSTTQSVNYNFVVNKKTKNILLTFDYELFLGENSGSVYNSILKPTDLILSSLKKLNLKNALFFVDTLYLYRLKNTNTNKAQVDFLRIYGQLIQILKDGHFIFAHIHTHWFNANYNPEVNRWHLTNLLHYRFQSVTPQQQSLSFEFSIQFIKDLQVKANVFYDIDCYRAGGWCIQPFTDFKPYFIKYGLKYDFSVLKNFSLDHNFSFYNFENFPNQPIYNFEDDISIATENGSFKEFTITSIPFTKNKIILNKIFLKFAYKLNYINYGDGKSAKRQNKINEFTVDETSEKIYRSKFNNEMTSIELMTSIKENEYKKFINSNSFMHFISHPKMISKHNMYCFQNFIQSVQKKYTIETDFKKML